MLTNIWKIQCTNLAVYSGKYNFKMNIYFTPFVKDFVSSPNFLIISSLFRREGRVGKLQMMFSNNKSTAVVIDPLWLMHPKHSTIKAAMKKIGSISAIPCTSAHFKTGMKAETWLWKHKHEVKLKISELIMSDLLCAL